MTYKSTCRSTLKYGAPIWAPVISNTNWKHLDVIQNEALCIATVKNTVCHRMASNNHLHQETTFAWHRRLRAMSTTKF